MIKIKLVEIYGDHKLCTSIILEETYNSEITEEQIKGFQMAKDAVEALHGSSQFCVTVEITNGSN